MDDDTLAHEYNFFMQSIKKIHQETRSLTRYYLNHLSSSSHPGNNLSQLLYIIEVQSHTLEEELGWFTVGKNLDFSYHMIKFLCVWKRRRVNWLNKVTELMCRCAIIHLFELYSVCLGGALWQFNSDCHMGGYHTSIGLLEPRSLLPASLHSSHSSY